jgi:capsular polysaccharide biosynthesis protein
LLAKKLQSEMATNLEKRQQGEQFRVIDPPNLPQKPYWPNRPMWSLAGLGLGTVLGLGIIILLELINPLVYRDEELQDLLGKKVLVCIPPLPTESEQRQQARFRILEGAAASAMLMVISAVTFLVFFKG